MKKRLIKKEWEDHIQDFKESGLSKAAWCQKQNLPVHRLYYWLKKLSPQADSPTESKRTKWVSVNIPPIEETIHTTIPFILKKLQLK